MTAETYGIEFWNRHDECTWYITSTKVDSFKGGRLWHRPGKCRATTISDGYQGKADAKMGSKSGGDRVLVPDTEEPGLY